jgi:hypothetical protein
MTKAAKSKTSTRSLVGSFDQAAPADNGEGEANEAVVDVEAAFPAHGEAAELVQQGEGLFDDAAQFAEAFDATVWVSDDRLGAAGLGGTPRCCIPCRPAA